MNELSATEPDPRPCGSPSAGFFRGLLADAPLGVVFVNPDFHIVYANSAAARILGLDASEAPGGRPLADVPQLSQDVVLRRIRRCLKTGEFQPETVHIDQGPADSRTVRIHASRLRDRTGATTGVELILEDAAEARRPAPPHFPRRRLESMGILADGIARDLSNILWEIVGNMELAAAEIEIGHPARYNLEQAEAASRRAQELILRILRFSRHAETKRRPVKLGSIVAESLQQLAAELPDDIRIESHLSTEMDLVLAEPAELLQLLSHLYSNAIQAMSETGGRLEVSVVDVQLEADELGEHPGLLPGRYLILTVMDTGPGVVPEILDQVFDPFFTTKSPEHHTGLGLAIVKSIARSCGGAVSLDSRPGKGAMAHLLLPALHEASAADRSAEPPLPSGVGTILLVDSDPAVCQMRSRMIHRLGYEVETAESSLEAIEKLKKNPVAYDLVLTDQSMPDLPATQMAERMKQIREEIPILLCTGFSGPEAENEARAAGIDRLVFKPLQMKDLAMILRDLLSPPLATRPSPGK